MRLIMQDVAVARETSNLGRDVAFIVVTGISFILEHSKLDIKSGVAPTVGKQWYT